MAKFLTLLTLALAVPATAAAAVDTRAPAAELHAVTSNSSNGADFVRYQQRVGGVPVLGAEAVSTDGTRVAGGLLIDDTRRRIDDPSPPAIDAAAAVAAAEESLSGSISGRPEASLAILPSADGGQLVWRVVVDTAEPSHEWEVLVNADDGGVVRTRDQLRFASTPAMVYDPNPVVAQGSYAGLSDGGGANSPLLDSLRTPVTLPRLDATGTCLSGQWIRVETSGGLACPPGGDFTVLRRASDLFDGATAYFSLDRTQAYIESLGFTNVLNSQLPVFVDTIPDDNSFYSPEDVSITTGTGGVDDAEDADVLVHEYGHAVQDDQVPGFGASSDAAAMGEGFGDYLQGAMSATYSPNHGEFDLCMAEWDATSYVSTPPICLRRLDSPMTLSQARSNPSCDPDEHCVGQVWSAALWSIRSVLGGTLTDRLVIQSQFSYTQGVSFAEAGAALLAADAQLNGGAGRGVITAALASREIIDLARLDDLPSGATPLSVPGTASGDVSNADDPDDVYAVSLQAGVPVQLRVQGGGDPDLYLLRPGASSLTGPGEEIASATTGGADETIKHTPAVSGTYFVDVHQSSGAGAYTLTASLDRDGDGVVDESDDCPAAADAKQRDWDEDQRGDACDPSSALRRVRLRARPGGIDFSASVSPASVRPADVTVAARRIVCRRNGERRACHLAPAQRAHARARRGDSVTGRLRGLRPGRYRVSVALSAAGYDRQRSHVRTLRLR